ncbi:lysozyme c-1 [Amyelois transitella]|uniref:lysozyme c-1 n=1 Tax=Amyelois transitella TaxID=680683 RepID=UPI00067E5D00|nr:lysozyme c-1 [Amyelois transitella]
MKIYLAIVLLVCFNCECKIFTRCKLAVELLNTRIITKTFLGNWVCLIEKVSYRNTKLLTETPSKKKYYGLYQIPQKWCKEKKRGGECNIACESLLDDDIRDDTECASMIADREGFKYWPQWSTRCKNDDFITQEIYKCPDLNTRTSPEKTPPEAMKIRSYFNPKINHWNDYLGPFHYNNRPQWIVV